MSPSTATSTSTPLHLFPSQSSSLPRKSSLKKPLANNASTPQSDFQGVAWQVTATSKPTSHVRPADYQIKHQITGGPSPVTSSLKVSNVGSPKRQVRTRRRSSAPSFASIQAASEPLLEEDQLSPLPINTAFVPSTPPRIRTPIGRLRRPNAPENVSVSSEAKDATADADQLSPLPSKQFFRPPTPPKTEFPSPQSFRSGGSTLARSNSDATGKSPSSANSTPAMPMRSMFPTYDHSKPLAQQQYFPHSSAMRPTFHRPQTNKTGISPEMHALHREDSAIGLVDSYQNVPQATESDLLAIWHASTTHSPPAGRKVQLPLAAPARGAGTSLLIGPLNQPVFTMSTSASSDAKIITVQKTCPGTHSPDSVAQLDLPLPASPTTQTSPLPDSKAPLTTIFPHQAAVAAIRHAATTPHAQEIAASDPYGTSARAARLAQNAVSRAHGDHACTLKRTANPSTSAPLSASYTLFHPSLGNLPITVAKAPHPKSGPRDPKIKIALHHPSATPAAVAAENLVLLELDFAHERCIIDTPALGALDEGFVIDTAVSAVCAVAVVENDEVIREELTFAAPPKTPIKGAKGREGRWSRREKVKREEKGMGLAKGGLAALELGVRGAVWLVGKGVRIGAGAVRAHAR